MSFFPGAPLDGCRAFSPLSQPLAHYDWDEVLDCCDHVQRLDDGVIQITSPWCIGADGTGVSPNIAPVVLNVANLGRPLVISGRLIWPTGRVSPQSPGSLRVILGRGGVPLGFWIRASARGLPDPGLVHPGPCPRGPLVRPGVRLGRSRPTLGSVTGPGSLRNGSRP